MKMYKAVSESICISDFGTSLKDGWYSSTGEALQSFKANDKVEAHEQTVQPTKEVESNEPKRRGRPRKEEIAL